MAEVVDAYAEIVKGRTMGDPWDPATQVGPVLNGRQLGTVLGYIESGRRQGAWVVTGGSRSERFDRGFFVEPTIFADVAPDMKIAREEIFGPVVTEAIKIANDTDLGLSGSVFSADPERAFDVASQIKAGHLSVNRFEIAPSVPVGGLRARARGLETKAVFMPGPA